MLTQKDIQNLKEVFGTKEDLVSKGDLILVKEDLSTKIGELPTKREFNKLQEIMATKDDICRLSLEIVDIKEIMATKDELKVLDDKFERLIGSIDNYAKKVDDYFQEMISMNQKLTRHEKWIQQLAQKFDVKLEY